MNSTSGNAAAPCETRYAGPVNGTFKTGVTAFAVPITDPAGHPAGLVSNCASVQAFCSVVRREGSASGSCRSTLWMFASPGFWVTLTTSEAPSALLVVPWVEAVKPGLKGRFLQPVTANGLVTAELAPCAAVIVPLIDCESQLVGLNMNSGRLTSTSIVFSLNGTPSMLCGSGSLVTVSCAVLGFTLIVERTTTLPRSNGPAFAGTTIERPNGAPLYGPVRYTGPDSHSGSVPAPEATVAVPICDADEHVPSAACGSPQSATFESIPARPAGVVIDTPAKSCSPSWRVKRNVNGL